jgi:acyl carrier protein
MIASTMKPEELLAAAFDVITMPRDKVRDRIANVIASELGLSASILLLDTSLADMGIDSLALLEIQFAIEDEFHVRFDDEGASAEPIIPDTVSEFTDELFRQCEHGIKQLKSKLSLPSKSAAPRSDL